MYGGIYQKIRHPQAVGEFPLWWVIAFLVHSPFLVLFSFLYVPVWYSLCLAEERDLVLRYGATIGSIWTGPVSGSLSAIETPEKLNGYGAGRSL